MPDNLFRFMKNTKVDCPSSIENSIRSDIKKVFRLIIIILFFINC